MNQFRRCFLTALPLLMFLVLGQLSQPRQQIIITIFVLFSGLFCFSGHAPETSSARTWLKNGLVLLCFTILILTGFPIGGYLAKPLMLPHSTENAQAILVLASGSTKTGDPGFSGLQRVSHGARLLKQGRAPLLFISTGYSQVTQHAEAAWVSSYTSLLEINPASLSILVSNEIVTTATEASYAKKQLEKLGINRILLVTSGAHIYRSCQTFARTGIETLPAPVHNAASVLYGSEHNLTAFNAAVHEWVGLLYYYLRDRI